MKKVFYSIAIMSAMLFASCSEDRGKTYETADSNRNENVNPSHLRDNDMAMSTTTGENSSDVMWRNNSERIAARMSTDLELDDQTRNRVQQTLYERERRLSELEGQYNYSETNRMGGQVAEDVDNTATRDRSRIDRDGGTMTDTRTNTGTNMQQNTTTDATNLQTDRERVMEETDRELQSILTQDQYRKYQAKRATYWGMQNDGTNQLQNRTPNNNNLPESDPNAGNDMNRN